MNQGCALVLLGLFGLVTFPVGLVICIPLMIVVALIGDRKDSR